MEDSDAMGRIQPETELERRILTDSEGIVGTGTRIRDSVRWLEGFLCGQG